VEKNKSLPAMGSFDSSAETKNSVHLNDILGHVTTARGTEMTKVYRYQIE